MWLKILSDLQQVFVLLLKCLVRFGITVHSLRTDPLYPIDNIVDLGLDCRLVLVDTFDDARGGQ